MHRAFVYLIIAIVSYIIYVLVNHLIRSRSRTRRAIALGCDTPPTVFCLDPFGFGNVRNLLKADSEKRLPDWLLDRTEQLQKENGNTATTIRAKAPPGKWNYFTSEPDNIKAILAAQFNDFSLGEARTLNLEKLLGVGIVSLLRSVCTFKKLILSQFTSDGKEWAHSRALLRPQFSRGQVADLTIEEEHVQTMTKVIDRNVDPLTGWTDEIDLQPLFFNLTLDTATQFLFGESADSQLSLLGRGNLKKPGRIDFAKEFDLSQRLVARASRFGDLWWLGHTKELRDSAKLVHEYVDYYVRVALDQPIEEKDTNERYIFLKALAQETRNPIELRAQLLNILLAVRKFRIHFLS
jgi:cytochrome P450